MIDFMNLEENVSDEMLAAYIDGNATPEESSTIQNALSNDELLAEAIDVVNDTMYFSNSVEETETSSSGISELMQSSFVGLNNNFSLESIGEHFTGGNSQFGDSFGIGLTAADLTATEEESHSENDDSSMGDGSESWDNTDDYGNMDN